MGIISFFEINISINNTTDPIKKKYEAASLAYSPKKESPVNSLKGIKNIPIKNRSVYIFLSVNITLLKTFYPREVFLLYLLDRLHMQYQKTETTAIMDKAKLAQ